MAIICATDFSPSATQAGRIAARMADRLGESLLLVNAVEPMVLAYPMAGPMLGGLESQVISAAEEALLKAAEPLRDTAREVATRVVTGPADGAIVDLAGETRAPLIVVGSRGQRRLGRMLLGSVAERVIRRAPCPVLVVEAPTNGFDEWVLDGRPLRLVVGVDSSVATEAALAWVRRLRQVGPCRVTLVHAYWPASEDARIGVKPTLPGMPPAPDVVATLERELHPLLEKSGRGETALRVVPEWSLEEATLSRIAQEENADLVVVGTHQRHGLARLARGSVAVAVVRQARRPVLCVPGVGDLQVDIADEDVL